MVRRAVALKGRTWSKPAGAPEAIRASRGEMPRKPKSEPRLLSTS